MRGRGRRGRRQALLLLLTVLVPTAAHAQAGFYVTPSFSVAEIYDDNVFVSATRRESDVISRVSPGLQIGYQSAPLTLVGRYTLDAEVYPKHPELTAADARQQAAAEVRYLPDPRLTLSLDATYMTTQTPGEFNTDTGLQTGRVPARRVSAMPALAYKLDPISTVTGDYTFAEDNSGSVRTDIHGVDLGYERRFTARDTGSLRYAFRHFSFPDGTSNAHVLLLGWTRDIMPLTTVALQAGPRFSDGSLDPEIAVSIRRTFKHGEVSLGYTRTQATVVGETGVVETESVGATLVYRPLPSLEIRVVPGFFVSTRGDLEAKVYRVAVEAAYQITKWLSLTGSYQFSLQRGNLVPNANRNEEIERNVLGLSLVAVYPIRLR